MLIRFDDELVLVTGAAGGIGRATSIAFAAAGARLVLVDQAAALGRLESIAQAIAAQGGRPALVRGLDIADRQACRALAADVVAAAGPVRHLVNNAGTDGKADVGSAEADDLWDRVLGVNAGGVHNMVAAFVAQLVQTRGTILNVGSTLSFIGKPRSAAYAASKAAVHNLTQSLALELAPRGVRVNMLAPGVTESGLTAGLLADPQRLEAFLSRIPMARVARPEDMTGAILFACSAQAGYMTGSTIRVDGGWLAQ